MKVVKTRVIDDILDFCSTFKYTLRKTKGGKFYPHTTIGYEDLEDRVEDLIDESAVRIRNIYEGYQHLANTSDEATYESNMEGFLLFNENILEAKKLLIRWLEDMTRQLSSEMSYIPVNDMLDYLYTNEVNNSSDEQQFHKNSILADWVRGAMKILLKDVYKFEGNYKYLEESKEWGQNIASKQVEKVIDVLMNLLEVEKEDLHSLTKERRILNGVELDDCLTYPEDYNKMKHKEVYYTPSMCLSEVLPDEFYEGECNPFADGLVSIYCKSEFEEGCMLDLYLFEQGFAYDNPRSAEKHQIAINEYWKIPEDLRSLFG